MAGTGVQRPIENEYRSIISDNRRWDRFTPRAGDVFVCTPAKCGTTWMQTIVTALIHPDGAPGPVMEIAPWFDARFEPLDVIVDRLDAQEHRRQVKSHTNADGIPWYPDTSYIAVYRDGRDAFMSFLNHMRNIRPDLFMELAMSAVEDGIDLGAAGGPPPVEDVHEFFAYWIEQPFFFEHFLGFWERRDDANVLLAHYDDMKADLEGQMRRVAAFLEIDVPADRWPGLVEQCTFAGMKARADQIADFEAHFVGGADTFLYKGTNGRWRDVLTDDELARFEQRQVEVLPPDAIAWLTGTPESRAATP
jgi:aryl sulfotransferase